MEPMTRAPRLRYRRISNRVQMKEGFKVIIRNELCELGDTEQCTFQGWTALLVIASIRQLPNAGELGDTVITLDDLLL